MKPKPRSARVPHLRRLADTFFGTLDAMTDAELRAVRREVKRLSETNCWWLAYRIAPLADVLADGLLGSRRRASRARKEEQGG